MIIGIDASKAAAENRTGVENYTYQLILNLQKIDQKNTYYLYTNKKLPIELTGKANFIEKYTPFSKFWNKIHLPLAIIKDKPEKYLQPVYMIPRYAPKKSIGVFHDLAWKKFPEAYSAKDISSQKRAIKNLRDQAEKIICVSNSAKDDLLSVYPALKDKTEVIFLASTVKASPIQYKDKLNLKSKYFFSFGRLEDRKNTKRIVEAFFAAKNQGITHKLVLVGRPGHGFEEISNTIKNNAKFAADVITPGFVDDEKLYDLILGAEAVIFPSLYEGFGIPALDAMSIGTPVITSNTSSMPEVVGDAAICVDPLDTEAITNAMLQISNDPNLRQELSLKGINQSNHFSWQKTAEQTLKLLEEL